MISNTQQGRIPFEPKFFAANGEKKAFAAFTVAINTGQKDESTGYYKELNVRCRTFGGWAESLMNKWNETGNRTVIDFDYELTMGNDYEKDGEIKEGQLEFNVVRIHDYNTLDRTLLKAKIPNFETPIRYTQGTGDKKSYAFFSLSVSTGIKNEETGYYEEKIVKAKAFGFTADFLNSYYQKGDFILLDGKFVPGQDYEKDGELVKADQELLVNMIHGFPKRKEGAANTSSKKAPATTPGKPGGAKPGAAKPGGLSKGGLKPGGAKPGAKLPSLKK